MAILLFIVGPLGYLMLGKLVGLSVAASSFYGEAGKRLGKRVSFWCMLLFPAAYLFLLIVGGEGNAGYGITIFGSELLFELLAAGLMYGVPVLVAYTGVLYIIRDLTLGHGTSPAPERTS